MWHSLQELEIICQKGLFSWLSNSCNIYNHNSKRMQEMLIICKISFKTNIDFNFNTIVWSIFLSNPLHVVLTWLGARGVSSWGFLVSMNSCMFDNKHSFCLHSTIHTTKIGYDTCMQWWNWGKGLCSLEARRWFFRVRVNGHCCL
jgi:hypothetical protein